MAASTDPARFHAALLGGLHGALRYVETEAPNSMVHYALSRAAETYAQAGPDGRPPSRPKWFQGIVDGGKD